MSEKAKEIQQFIIDNVSNHPNDIAKIVSEHFQITRQAVNKHLRKLVEEGILQASGATRNRIYSITKDSKNIFHFAIKAGITEDKVWRDHIRPLLNDISPQALKICEFGFLEMMNNAIEHSEGGNIVVEVNPSIVEIMVFDDGYGIFRKIKRVCELEDEKHAILELSKGKLTTDPRNHTGQGIFFTSRAFDKFMILSEGLFFSHYRSEDDWLMETKEKTRGTLVRMKINPYSTRSLKALFDSFTTDEDYGFDRTIVPVELARYGDENLVSRSQARRLLTRFEKFKVVVLDFQDVPSVGQAFADEIFRVYYYQHPDVKIDWTNSNPDIDKMIRRAIKGRDESLVSK